MGVFGRRVLPVLGIAGAALVLTAAPARADICDLTDGSGTTSCFITGFNTGLFSVDYQHPTGTGVIDPFLRLQQKGSEQGYNTSARTYPPGNSDTQFDEKTDPNYTRNLLLSEVETKTIGTTTYREFFLDINEPASQVGTKYLITLDQLEIYVSNTPNLDYYTASNFGNDQTGALNLKNGTAPAVKIYDMDTATKDNWVQLDYLVSGQGSGSSDMVFLLDSSLFGNYQYVYLYSQFGDSKNKWNKYESQAGFEEWFTRAGSPPPPGAPEPATLVLLGTGLALGIRRLRRA